MEIDSKPRPVWFVLTLAGAIGLILGIGFPGTVRETVLIPLQYLVWLSGLILRSVDQLLWWAAVIFVVGITLLRIVGVKGQPIIPVHVQESVRAGRVNYWAMMIERTRRGWYTGETFRYELKKLALSIISDRVRQERSEVERGLEHGELALPPEIQALFSKSGRLILPDKPRPRLKLLSTRFLRQQEEDHRKFEQDLEAILLDLEQRLEIIDDSHHP